MTLQVDELADKFSVCNAHHRCQVIFEHPFDIGDLQCPWCATEDRLEQAQEEIEALEERIEFLERKD